MPDSLGLSHQVMNSLHQLNAAKVSSEEEREKEEDGTGGSQPDSRYSGLPAVLAPRQRGEAGGPLSSDSGMESEERKVRPSTAVLCSCECVGFATHHCSLPFSITSFLCLLRQECFA